MSARIDIDDVWANAPAEAPNAPAEVYRAVGQRPPSLEEAQQALDSTPEETLTPEEIQSVLTVVLRRSAAATASRSSLRRRRLALERLEDRNTPSAVGWSLGFDSAMLQSPDHAEASASFEPFWEDSGVSAAPALLAAAALPAAECWRTSRIDSYRRTAGLRGGPVLEGGSWAVEQLFGRLDWQPEDVWNCDEAFLSSLPPAALAGICVLSS